MDKSKKYKTLKDLGENGILHRLIVPRFPPPHNFLLSIGDDCAAFFPKQKGHAIITTTDPCPTPVANLLGYDDYYNYGWLTVVINVSDLGSMGAEPIGLLTSTVMPEDMLITDYERFLDGLSDASNRFNCPIVGGNIKDGKEFTASGSAFGSVDPDLMMQRKGALSGDFICVIGEMGIFWASVVSHLKNIEIDNKNKEKANESILKPVPKIFEGIQLAKQKALTSCMDSSDGVTSCLYTIAQANKVDIVIDLNSLRPHPLVTKIADQAGVDYRKLMLSWGGWELVGTVSPEKLNTVSQISKSLGVTCNIIGNVVEGDGNVWASEQDKKGVLSDLGSYRFCGTSFFSHGLEAYIDYLFNTPIYT